MKILNLNIFIVFGTKCTKCTKCTYSLGEKISFLILRCSLWIIVDFLNCDKFLLRTFMYFYPLWLSNLPPFLSQSLKKENPRADFKYLEMFAQFGGIKIFQLVPCTLSKEKEQGNHVIFWKHFQCFCCNQTNKQIKYNWKAARREGQIDVCCVQHVSLVMFFYHLNCLHMHLSLYFFWSV